MPQEEVMTDIDAAEFFDRDEVKNLSQIVAEKLQEMIYTGKLKPGERLIQNELASFFKVSRVAIRDALQELKQSGLAVSVSSSGGTCVRPISEKDISDVAFVRDALEPVIAVEACRKIDDDGISLLKDCIRKQVLISEAKDYIGYIHADWDFHKTLYSYAGNSLALDMIEKLWMRASQARGMVLMDIKWGEVWCKKSVNNHNLIVQAVVDRDIERLHAIIRNNITSAEKEQLEWLSQVKA